MLFFIAIVSYITLCSATKAHSAGEIQSACQIVQTRTVLDACLGTHTTLNQNGDLFEEKLV